jgi:arabinosyltransferase C
MSMPVWIVAFAAAVAASALLSEKNAATNLFISWALVGLVAIYFPALFQRKLAMGLAIPWSVLAAMGLASLLRSQDASARRLVTALGVLILGATSVRWAARELFLAQANVSNTSLHPVYLDSDVQKIFGYLNAQPGRKVLLALPGQWSAAFGQNKQEEAPNADLAPVMPDYNPIASGLTGVYTYAGHWSETPNYNQRRGEVTKLFLANITPEERNTALAKTGAQYILSPNPATVPVFDFSQLGEVVVDGERFRLIKVRPEAAEDATPAG